MRIYTAYNHNDGISRFITMDARKDCLFLIFILRVHFLKLLLQSSVSYNANNHTALPDVISVASKLYTDLKSVNLHPRKPQPQSFLVRYLSSQERYDRVVCNN